MCFYLCCQGLSVARPVGINHSGVIQRNNRGSKRKKQGNYKASIMEAPITAPGPVEDCLINGFIIQEALFWPADRHKACICPKSLSGLYFTVLLSTILSYNQKNFPEHPHFLQKFPNPDTSQRGFLFLLLLLFFISFLSITEHTTRRCRTHPGHNCVSVRIKGLGEAADCWEKRRRALI